MKRIITHIQKEFQNQNHKRPKKKKDNRLHKRRIPSKSYQERKKVLACKESERFRF